MDKLLSKRPFLVISGNSVIQSDLTLFIRHEVVVEVVYFIICI